MRKATLRQRSPGRGENHCFQKPRGPRLRVHRIDTHHGLLGSEKAFPLQSSCKIRHPLY